MQTLDLLYGVKIETEITYKKTTNQTWVKYFASPQPTNKINDHRCHLGAVEKFEKMSQIQNGKFPIEYKSNKTPKKLCIAGKQIELQ